MGNDNNKQTPTYPTMGEDVTGEIFGNATTYGELKELARGESDAFLMGTYFQQGLDSTDEMSYAIDEVLTERGLAHNISSDEWRQTADSVMEDMAYEISNMDELYTPDAWADAIDEFMGKLYNYENDELAELLRDPPAVRAELEYIINER